MEGVSPPEKTSASVAFRLKRPYASEDELVAGDGHGVRKSGMMLFGAAPRSVGLIVRFEIALRDGTPVFRGEGKVVAHHPSPDPSQPGALQVRFTRLDPRGKALVDRAVARNEGRPPTSTPSPMSLPPPSRDSGPSSQAAPLSIIPSPPESFSLDLGAVVIDPADPTPAPLAVSERDAVLRIPAPPRVPDPTLLGRTPAPAPLPDTADTDLSHTRVAETVVAPVPQTEPTPALSVAALSPSQIGEPEPAREHTLLLEPSRPKTLIPSVDLDIPVDVEIEADEPTVALSGRASQGSINLDAPLPPGSDLDEPTIALTRDKLAPRADEALPAFEPEHPLIAAASGPLPPVLARAPEPALIETPAPTAVAPTPAAPIDPDALPTPEDQTTRLTPKHAPEPATHAASLIGATSTTGIHREALLARLRARRQDAGKREAAPRDATALDRLRTRTASR